MCVHLYVHINACVYVCVYIPMCVSTYVQHGEWGICLLQRVGICYHGGWGVQRATVWQVCESPQCSSYLTEDTKLGVNAMPSSLKAGGCEPEKSRCFHLSLKEGAQCSSSSRGSGFPLPLTHRPELCFYPGCLVEVYPLRRAYILFSLTIQVWIPSPTTLQTHLDIVWTYISAPHDPVKLPWRTNHRSFFLPGFQLGCFFGKNGLQRARGFSWRNLSSVMFLHFQVTICVHPQGSSFWFWL